MLENLLEVKFISLILIGVAGAIGGVYPFFRKIKAAQKMLVFPIGETLASGVFLGAGLLHMLSNASLDFHTQGYDYPYAMLLAGSIFLLLLLFEHIAREFRVKDEQDNPFFAVLAVVMLSVHSFLEGAALGLTTDFSVLLVILFAILAHKGAASFSLAVQITKSKLAWVKGLILFACFVLMTPIGILFGQGLHVYMSSFPILEPTFTALAAGTFLYLGTLHGLKRAVMVEQCCNLQHFSYVILGFVIMAVVAIWT